MKEKERIKVYNVASLARKISLPEIASRAGKARCEKANIRDSTASCAPHSRGTHAAVLLFVRNNIINFNEVVVWATR